MVNKTFTTRRMLLASALGSTALSTLPAAQETAPSVSEKAVMRIAREVQRAVLNLPNYGLFDDIRFSIKGYDVTLKGYASRPTLKASVEQVVKKIEGVEKVTNQITVLSFSRFDDDIRVRTYVAIYGHPALSRYNPNRGTPLFQSRASLAAGITNDPPIGYHPIHIIVNNGKVALEGVVDSAGDRTIAELQANGVSGAFEVSNNLQVSNQERMSDMKKPAR